jgi:hypothetical protein
MKRLISKDPVYDALIAFRKDHPDASVEMRYPMSEMIIEFVMQLHDDPKRTATDRIPYSRLKDFTENNVGEFIYRCLTDTYKLLQEEKKGDICNEPQRDTHDQEPQKQKDVRAGQ